tara:strand:- start:1555 stop:1773 length:219 start_codon:yes stop_codon:yes gene_type:complete
MFGLEIIVIFVIIWWLVLFLALPIGIQRDHDVTKGNDPGAPKNPMLKKKIVFTTIISFFLSIIISIFKNEIF